MITTIASLPDQLCPEWLCVWLCEVRVSRGEGGGLVCGDRRGRRPCHLIVDWNTRRCKKTEWLDLRVSKVRGRGEGGEWR